MDKCPNCGNKINRMDVLCPRCGAVVEDVHVKNRVKIDQSGISDITASAEPKKNFPQNFIVYNEDFPAGDEEVFGGENTEGEPDGAVPSVSGEAAGIPVPEEERDYYVPSDTEDALDESGREEAGAQESKPYEAGTLRAIKTQDENEDEDYSERYLERIKELPEIDDISNFDPEEYMKKYRLSKNMYGNVPSGTVPENINFNEKVTKHYLEIEEIIPSEKNGLPEEQFKADAASRVESVPPLPDEERAAESEEAALPQNEPGFEQTEVQPGAVPEEHRYSPDAPMIGHRYNPDAPRRRNKNEGAARNPDTEKTDYEQPAERQEVREEANPPKPKGRRHMHAAVAAVLWLAVIAGLFAGFFFFDRYVKATYGGYGTFIYSITNGKIDLGTGAQAK